MPVIHLLFADGERFTLPARDDETVLNAARRQGLSLASDCESGDCQTCVATIKAGKIIARDGKIVGKANGRYLPRKPAPARHFEWFRSAQA